MDIISRLKSQNEKYVNAEVGSGNISVSVRKDTAINGQKPYVAILTCADSRVIPEYIFSAGIGEIFTVRNAGNVVDGASLASLEYAADHLHVEAIVVMGHDYCGAVNAAVAGATGYISPVTERIAAGTKGESDIEKATSLNIQNSIDEIMKSAVISELVASKKLQIVGAMYSTAVGTVEFLK